MTSWKQYMPLSENARSLLFHATPSMGMVARPLTSLHLMHGNGSWLNSSRSHKETKQNNCKFLWMTVIHTLVTYGISGAYLRRASFLLWPNTRGSCVSLGRLHAYPNGLLDRGKRSFCCSSFFWALTRGLTFLFRLINWLHCLAFTVRFYCDHAE